MKPRTPRPAGKPAGGSRPRKPAAKAGAAGARRAVKPAAGAGAAARETATLKARLERERRQFERRLTDMVREIGQLRHHEARAAQLERQLEERDQTVARLRRELADARGSGGGEEREGGAQPSLAFGASDAREGGAPREID